MRRKIVLAAICVSGIAIFRLTVRSTRALPGVGVPPACNQPYTGQYCNSPTDDYSWYSSITPPDNSSVIPPNSGITPQGPVKPSSQVFCGKSTIQQVDPFDPLQQTLIYNYDGSDRSVVNAYGWCLALWGTDYVGGFLGIGMHHWQNQSRRPAILAEIRGWIVGGDLPPLGNYVGDDEQEYHLNVSLDMGWTPAPETVAYVTPINRVSTLMDVMPAFNLAAFNGRSANGDVWGGPGAAVVHVEYNAWSKGRTYDIGTFPGGPDTFVPANWRPVRTFLDASGQPWNAYLPFSPYFPANLFDPSAQPYKNGDYVRLVGLLWEDEPHLNDYPSENKKCWDDNGYHSTRGWLEMHSVDYMVKISPPAISRPPALYQSCSSGTYTVNFRETVFPKPPYPNSYLVGVNEWIGARWNGQTTGLVGITSNTSYDVRVLQTSIAGLITTGFYAGYDPVWGCKPNKCGTDDGCGNLAAMPQCSAGYTCSAGQCVCNAPGYSWCATSNDCRLTTQCCVPNCSGSCGGTANGCGGTCPTVSCGTGYSCSAGTCIANPPPPPPPLCKGCITP